MQSVKGFFDKLFRFCMTSLLNPHGGVIYFIKDSEKVPVVLYAAVLSEGCFYQNIREQEKTGRIRTSSGTEGAFRQIIYSRVYPEKEKRKNLFAAGFCVRMLDVSEEQQKTSMQCQKTAILSWLFLIRQCMNLFQEGDEPICERHPIQQHP